MATHSSTLAWKIPWAEEPGGLHPVSDTTERLHFQKKNNIFKKTAFASVAQFVNYSLVY